MSRLALAHSCSVLVCVPSRYKELLTLNDHRDIFELELEQEDTKGIQMRPRTEAFRRQHFELEQLANQLKRQLNEKSYPQNIDDVQTTLSAMEGLLRIHLAMEDNALYPKLMADQDPEIRALAIRFREDFGSVYQTFTDFRRKWNAERMAKEPDEFPIHAKQVLQALTQRIQQENETLYPRVDAIEPPRDLTTS